MTQKLWDTVKAVLRRRFIAIQAYLKKQEKSQINNLNLYVKIITEQIIKKETQTLNDTVDQLHLIDIYRTFHPKTTSLFSQVHMGPSPE